MKLCHCERKFAQHFAAKQPRCYIYTDINGDEVASSRYAQASAVSRNDMFIN